MLAAVWSAFALRASTARLAGRVEVLGVPELHAAGLGGGQRVAGPGGDQAALLLRQGRVDVEEERVDVRPQLGDDEGHALGHEAADEGHVPR
jgi:hypothetical protein